MGSFGERLQREREMRGISLEEIAEATKIGTRSLRALEQEEFDQLPGGIFNKGFVRAYSRYLGIDEEQAVADYMAALAAAQPSPKVPEEGESAVVEKNLGNIDDDDELGLPRLAWGLLAVLIVVGIGAVAGLRYVSQHGWPQLRRAQTADVQLHKRAVPPLPAMTAPTAPTPPPTAPAVSEKVVQAKTPAETGFLLRVRAKRDTWVLIVVDGKEAMQGTLAAATEKQVRAQRKVVFKAGNAGAIELFQDGKPLPLFGEENQVRQVTITAQGIAPEVKTKKAE